MQPRHTCQRILPPVHSAAAILRRGAKVLGPIQVGDYAKVASGSVVLKPVPAHCTVAGVPAKVVNVDASSQPARSMDHTLAELADDYVI